MSEPRKRDVQTSYDLVADEYTRRIAGELDHKPLDRELLDRFAALVQPLGPVCDLGCGPGHVAHYLHRRGARVVGIDLSPVMVGYAKRRNPEIEFRQGDMQSLQDDDGTWGGIAAFYSLIHIPLQEIPAVLRECRRVLKPGGWLFLAFHIGDDVLHLDEWWGQQVSIDFFLFRPEAMTRWLEEAGFQGVEVIERDPYPDVEHPSRRAYLFAQRPPGV